jgi:2,3-bisphosphoglycerate-independent phosphoglycerate mutase
MKVKYAILVGDGMADHPIPELGNMTPLQYAKTPNMDSIVSNGVIGLVSTVPQGFAPGSDVANLSLMGYDPHLYYSGRAPIEAASLGIPLSEQETAFRCNLVTIENNRMVDYSAGHFDTHAASEIIKDLQNALDTETVHFYPGVSYRHLTIISRFPAGLTSTPPHDITDQDITEFLPRGNGSEIVLSLMKRAKEILLRSDSNKKRIKNGLRPATDIWLWGQGHAKNLPTMQKMYGIHGSVISAVDLVRGLGKLAGLNVRIVDGATGYLGTNYAGKVAAAFKALETEDFVYVHIEAPDETSHEGSLPKKIQAIEEFDRLVVGEFIKYQHVNGNLRILVAPDHPTPVLLKTHTSDPVPYALSGPKIIAGDKKSYNEISAKGKNILTGTELFEYFLKD